MWAQVRRRSPERHERRGPISDWALGEQPGRELAPAIPKTREPPSASGACEVAEPSPLPTWRATSSVPNDGSLAALYTSRTELPYLPRGRRTPPPQTPSHLTVLRLVRICLTARPDYLIDLIAFVAWNNQPIRPRAIQMVFDASRSLGRGPPIPCSAPRSKKD